MSEGDFENCIVILITLPDTIVWIETPIVAQWDDHKNGWYTRYVYNTKYDPDEKTVEFRATKFGIYSIALPRYYNLPYTYWSLQPNSE